MGYELHITRRRQWSESGSDISEEEWRRVLETQADGALADLTWFDGIISVKHPEPPLIDRMVAIAHQLGATVQGDDGERYVSGTAPPQPYRPSLAERLRALIERLVPRRPLPPQPLPPFGVGDTVTDVWGQPATVVSIDPRAEHGLGIVKVRYPDGREAAFMLITHGLTKS